MPSGLVNKKNIDRRLNTETRFLKNPFPVFELRNVAKFSVCRNDAIIEF
jgi:hypothetical protein